MSKEATYMIVTAARTQDRNQMLLRSHKEHPKASYEQLGKMFAISRQRAWQLVQRSQVREKRKEKRDELLSSEPLSVYPAMARSNRRSLRPDQAKTILPKTTGY